MGKKRTEHSSTQENNVLVLDNQMTIADATRLRQQLLETLGSEKNVILDGSNVERVDTAALQVLTAFFKEASMRGITVQWWESSSALQKAAFILGLSHTLQLEQ